MTKYEELCQKFEAAKERSGRYHEIIQAYPDAFAEGVNNYLAPPNGQRVYSFQVPDDEWDPKDPDAVLRKVGPSESRAWYNGSNWTFALCISIASSPDYPPEHMVYGRVEFDISGNGVTLSIEDKKFTPILKNVESHEPAYAYFVRLIADYLDQDPSNPVPSRSIGFMRN